MSIKTGIVGNFNIACLCVICGETVKLNDYEQKAVNCGARYYKACDKCKDAVKHMRMLMESDNKR